MKISDDPKKSKVYLLAVLALRDKKDELVKQKSDTLATIATIRAKLEDIDARLIKAVDVDARKTLRTERKNLQETLEDYEAIKLDILNTLTALNAELQPQRMAARDELDALTDVANAEIESIQAKAREVILDLRDLIDAHPFQMADRIIENIMRGGGWQNLNGGQMDEPVKHTPSKDGPDPFAYLPEYSQFKKSEGHPWAGISRIFGNIPEG